MFSKILIANRGEIAVRIARTCWEMGIKPVAVFSDADRNALHVRACGEAYHIGPAAAAESYLRGDRIIETAHKAGCDAIHPGYGFLSENADFARAVTDAGLVWIGPPPEAMELMGSKIESKRLAQKLGVPVVPGYSGVDQSVGRLVTEADALGYPILIKASAGGGGKGMRVVESQTDLPGAIAAAQRESQAAFGDATILLEKYLSEPRHIEVQVLGDNFGKLIHLGERECSIQRRHQKVVEESPSPVVNDDLRDEITSAALKLAGAAGYTNAGTVEFIFQDGQFYFLEMNTRLQVEHPVTEQAVEIDLVRAQIQIAAGEPLWMSQENVRFDAHAFEARLYAEDPEHDFLPSTGTITALEHLAEARIDAGVDLGDAISPYYDPMIAKIITWGETRQAALNQMREVLGGLKIEGLKTNLDFLRWLFAHPQFELGNLSTRFIERYYRPGAFPLVPHQAVLAAAALHTLFPRQLDPDKRDDGPWTALGWRQARQQLIAALEMDGHPYSVVFRSQPGQPEVWNARITQGQDTLFDGLARLTLVGATMSGDGFEEVPASIQIQIGEEAVQYAVAFSAAWQYDAFSVAWDGREYWARPVAALSTERLGTSVHLANEDTLESPMPGKVLKVLVKSGDDVTEEQPLVIIEAMKMEFTVRAPHDGKVSQVHYDEGAQVAVGDVLVELETKK